VEVTKLSLLLKVLEGESTETLQMALPGFQERALPNLDNNVKCGNSLIGPDYFIGQLIPDADELRRVNPFDWEREFPDAMKAGGFNSVIGNPPYLIAAGRLYADYLDRNYQLTQYQTDFYVFFIERSLKLALPEGKISFIVSDAWLNSQYFSKLRNYLLTTHRIDLIAIFDYPVFKGVTMENSVFVITPQATPSIIPIQRFASPSAYSVVNQIAPQDAIERGLIDPRQSLASEQVIKAIEKDTHSLEEYVRLNRGIHAYRTDGYGQSKFCSGPQTTRDKEEASYHADAPLDKTYLPELKGKDIDRFTFTPSGKFLSYGPWLAEPREPEFFYSPKIALRKILGQKLHGTFLKKPYALDQSLYVLISKNDDTSELKYLLGVLLSRLGAWYLRTKFSIYDKLYPWYTKRQLAEFPVKEKDERIVSLVDQMLQLRKRQAAASASDRELYQRQIDATDREIDRLVYELYGLTQEEIQVVAGND
jgi:hypothetical protein